MNSNKLLNDAWRFTKKHWIVLLLVKIIWGILFFLFIKDIIL